VSHAPACEQVTHIDSQASPWPPRPNRQHRKKIQRTVRTCGNTMSHLPGPIGHDQIATQNGIAPLGPTGHRTTTPSKANRFNTRWTFNQSPPQRATTSRASRHQRRGTSFAHLPPLTRNFGIVTARIPAPCEHSPTLARQTLTYESRFAFPISPIGGILSTPTTTVLESANPHPPHNTTHNHQPNTTNERKKKRAIPTHLPVACASPPRT